MDNKAYIEKEIKDFVTFAKKGDRDGQRRALTNVAPLVIEVLLKSDGQYELPSFISNSSEYFQWVCNNAKNNSIHELFYKLTFGYLRKDDEYEMGFPYRDVCVSPKYIYFSKAFILQGLSYVEVFYGWFVRWMCRSYIEFNHEKKFGESLLADWSDKEMCWVLTNSESNKKRENLAPSIRFDVMKRDKYQCQLCGATAKEGARLEVDHKHPVSKGGANDLSNLWLLCQACNIGKSDKLL